ncbi:hypothetical protein CAPTEDRAFT_100183 [Capitella teleta]|uniref:GH3 domain-containing protein n=1 Tax=Capitella teleta TaxID=283909 RepID=R7U6W9_CAPTE|nr:hypothetical protein CAPTEDRAFT_100183 [Capitella teleta]|eukprot:ELU01891.1 hypothetical protein CAPTEDRAFT_100183 [Capitella teleta]
MGAAEVIDQQTQTYITALFALAEKDLQFINGFFAPVCYTFFRMIEDQGEALCDDLENGSLSEDLKVDEEIRAEVNRNLRVEAHRVNQVRRELQKGTDGLALRLWPNLKMIYIAITGAFEPMYRMLKSSYIKGVYVKGSMHASTEAVVGFPQESLGDLGEKPRGFVFAHSSAFFEFIPEDGMDSASPRTIFLDQLQVGKTYEVLITTRNGLYRYRFGDVIKVVGFFDGNPIYEFKYRSGQLLNLKTEKTSENVFYDALRAAEMEWKGMSIVDYTATESTNVQLIPATIGEIFLPHDSSINLIELMLFKVDRKLREISKVYDTYRANGSIACMEVIQVKPGTFSKLKAVVIKDTNSQQYKTARANRKPELLTLLLGSRIGDKNI